MNTLGTVLFTWCCCIVCYAYWDKMEDYLQERCYQKFKDGKYKFKKWDVIIEKTTGNKFTVNGFLMFGLSKRYTFKTVAGRHINMEMTKCRIINRKCDLYKMPFRDRVKKMRI